MLRHVNSLSLTHAHLHTLSLSLTRNTAALMLRHVNSPARSLSLARSLSFTVYQQGSRVIMHIRSKVPHPQPLLGQRHRRHMARIREIRADLSFLIRLVRDSVDGAATDVDRRLALGGARVAGVVRKLRVRVSRDLSCVSY